MLKKRVICVVTGTRAEYGLLKNLMRMLEKSENAELKIVATGSHLEPYFGDTYKMIIEDGFMITKQVPLALVSDSPLSIAASLSTAVSELAKAFESIKPDLLVILGDRYEILGAAQAALILQIPMAHIHGGERTEGAIDEAIRHSLTKMSHLHFASCSEYRTRIIQLGENPKYVWNTGSIALDNFKNLNDISRTELLKSLNLREREHLILCTMHPETLLKISANDFISPLLQSLLEIPDANFIFTLGNADADGREINKAIQKFAKLNPSNTRVESSLGQTRYLNALKAANLVVGNSSSGIVEASSAGTVVVNIGDRQKGRIRSVNIIDVANSKSKIQNAIELGLSREMQELAKTTVSPYGKPGASKKIYDVITQIDLVGILRKNFYDIHVPKIKIGSD
jgi:GDP/UDP-N,N'-diacetylbacillosamine 2-epimerase (hydrolysing)